MVSCQTGAGGRGRRVSVSVAVVSSSGGPQERELGRQERELGRRWQPESDGGRLQHTVLELGPETDPDTATPGPSRPADTEPDHWEVSSGQVCPGQLPQPPDRHRARPLGVELRSDLPRSAPPATRPTPNPTTGR